EFVPMYYPVMEGDVLKEIVDLRNENVPSELEEWREKIVERAAEAKDELLEKYLEEGTLTLEEIKEGLQEEVKKGKLNIVIPGSVWEGKGIKELLEFIIENFPSPKERKILTVEGEEIECGEEGPFLAQVFKSTFEPHLGDMSLVRIFRGKLNSASEILNSSKDNTEKIGQIQKLIGKNRKEVSEASAGEIIGLLKLKNTSTSDTLTHPDSPVVLEPIKFPPPLYSIAVRPKERKDEEKISFALGKICQEDPTLHIEVNHEFGQTILSGMGELQLTLNLSKLSRYGVNVITEEPKVPYRETIKSTAKAQGKYKRQTGGRGQYGDCWIEISPLERGKGFEFVNKIFGGAIPARFIPAVEKGIREAMKKGLLAGYPVVDVKVTLYDGSFHPVDSSDIAFQIAGSLAFKNAYPQAQPTLLEPIMKVVIKAPEEYLGDITGDLNAKRGKILSIDAEGKKRVIQALVPLAEMHRYATELKSMTQGRGTFTMEFSHYEEVPSHIQAKIIQEYEKTKENEGKS
ncbi:MAG TPA: elongation factor G, partial [bacterium]|nr:elongation factor G [bacterium]HEX67518.1 elongation factor G [bacterium]